MSVAFRFGSERCGERVLALALVALGDIGMHRCTRPEESHLIDALIRARNGCMAAEVYDAVCIGDEIGFGQKNDVVEATPELQGDSCTSGKLQNANRKGLVYKTCLGQLVELHEPV